MNLTDIENKSSDNITIPPYYVKQLCQNLRDKDRLVIDLANKIQELEIELEHKQKQAKRRQSKKEESFRN